MNHIEAALAEFGRLRNVPQLAFNHEGTAEIDVDELGTLVLESAPHQAGHDLVLSAATKPLRLDAALLKRALSLVALSEHVPFAAHAALRDDQLVFAVRIPTSQFSVPNIQRGLDLLTDFVRRAA